jgi:protein-tyrosine phosphatase
MFNEAPEIVETILVNQPNFRDLGGISTYDNRNVKQGLLYRSGDLSKLSTEDIGKIEKIGIRMIIDFRSDREIINYPTPRISTVETNKRIIIVDSARDTAERMLAENDAEGLETILVKDYKRLVRDHQDDFREFFQVLASTNHLPLVYHCAAGKDRTGLATYLLLIALGVSPEEARNDYMQSNLFLKPLADKIILKVKDSGNNNAEIIRPLMEVRGGYLDSALHEIINQFDTVDRFLSDVLHVDRITLRKKYLE